MLKADKLVDVLREVGELEDAKKEAVSSFKHKIDGKTLEARILAYEIRTGAEMRPVECTERPRYGDMMVDVIRLDTGAVVLSRAMHPSERQLALEGDGLAATPDNDVSPAAKRRRRLEAKRDVRVMVDVGEGLESGQAAAQRDGEAGEAGDDGESDVH